MSAAARTLLVADDSITIQKVIDLTFRDEGFRVTTVSNGTAAIEIIERTMPDIVLLDAQMPKPDGYEVCRRMKRDARLRHIPVLLLVNSFEPYNEAEARRAGAEDILTKPFQSIRDLVNKVSSLLSSRAKDTEATEAKQPDSYHSNLAPDDSYAPVSASPENSARPSEIEKIAALTLDVPPGTSPDSTGYRYEQSSTASDERNATGHGTQSDVYAFAETEDDDMIQVAEFKPRTPASSHDETSPASDDEFETVEPQAEHSYQDVISNFDAPAPSTMSDTQTNRDDESVEPSRLDISTPTAFTHQESNYEAIDTAHPDDSNNAMTQADEPHSPSHFDDNQPAANELTNDDFPFALSDDAPLDLGEAEAPPSNNFDDAILDFGDAPAVANTTEQFAPAMIDVENFDFADDVEVTNVEATTAEDADTEVKDVEVERAPPVSLAAHETSDTLIAPVTLDALPPEVIERIARQVVAHLSENVLREIAWEVVPQLAERLIKERLDEDAGAK